MTLNLRPLEIQVPLAVKTYDIDFGGVVSNIVYVRWLEDLRMEMLTHYLPLDEILNDGLVPLIVQTKVDYKKSIKLFD
jgi:acyl-CoA thioester hydrolase